MTWTDTPPAAPGWYWWQPTYSDPEVVHVWRSGDTLLMFRVGRDSGRPLLAGVGRWSAEPVSPPEGGAR